MATHVIAHFSGVREGNRRIGLQSQGYIEPLERRLKLAVTKIADPQIPIAEASFGWMAKARLIRRCATSNRPC